MDVLQPQQNPLNLFAVNAVGSLASQYIQQQQNARENQMLQQAFADVNENTSPLTMLTKISSLNISPEKKEILLGGLKQVEEQKKLARERTTAEAKSRKAASLYGLSPEEAEGLTPSEISAAAQFKEKGIEKIGLTPKEEKQARSTAKYLGIPYESVEGQTAKQIADNYKSQKEKLPPISERALPQEQIDKISAIESNPDYETASPAKKLKMLIQGGVSGANADRIVKTYIEEEKAAKEEKKGEAAKATALRQETLPIRKEISDKAQSARQGIENKEKLLNLIDTGNINDPTFAAFAEALPLNFGKRMLSPETVQYKAGLIDEYKDLRTIFQGQTRIKEIELLEAKTADIYLTDEQKKAILKSRIDALQADLIREEAAAELENRSDLGVLQFRKEVEKLAKPKLKALFDKILDQQQAIIKDAENRKKLDTPLNPHDPSDRQIAEQILQEAGGNKVKAREIAKKKGYKL